MTASARQDPRKLAEQAIMLHRAGDPAAAIPLYRQLLKAFPKEVSLRVLAAEAYRATGDHAAEARVLAEAEKIDPKAPGPQVLLGQRAERMGDRRRAISHYDRVLAVEPKNREARLRRAVSLAGLKRFEEAEQALAALTRDHPEDAAPWLAAGVVALQRHKLAESEAAYRRVLAIDPNKAEAIHGLATVLDASGKTDAAIENYERAMALAPRDVAIKTNLATVLSRIGRMREAEELFEAALAIDPNFPPACNNMGSLLIKTGDVERGVALEMRAAERDPDNGDYASNVLFVSHYAPYLTPETIAEAHFAWGRKQARLVPEAPAFPNSPDPERRLKLGFVSADFRGHSVGYNFLPVLAARDRDRFECVLYSAIDVPDAMTERFRATADLYRPIAGLQDESVAEQVRADGIDILVDLAGHSAGNRLGVFARRPAPLQATYLGYPDTTGLACMDYRFVDAYTDPPGEADRWAGETLIRLPRGFIVALPAPDTPPVSVPPVFRNGHITFGSFNNLAKVNRQVIALWARVLLAVPGSRLLLKSSLNSDDWVHDRFRAAFAEGGVGPERLEFRTRTKGAVEHLMLYGEVDIALDPFPYSGTMTTLEGLMMGVPLLTLPGRHHVSRVSASLLTQVGHPEWIASDAEDYVAKAVETASDRTRLAAVRMRLREEYMASSLADAPGLAGAMEGAYRDMWRRWCAAQKSTDQKAGA